MRGLVVREPWISKILSGEKTWELRSRATQVRGRIALIRKGSGRVVGTAVLKEVLPALDRAGLMTHQSMHGVPEEKIDEVLAQRWVTPWVLSDVQMFEVPVPYIHPMGAVTWVDLGNFPLQGGQSAGNARADGALVVDTVAGRECRTVAPDTPLLAVVKADMAVTRGSDAGLPWVDIELTAGAIAQGYLALRSARSLLPLDAIGGGNRARMGRLIRIRFSTGETVESDVDGEKMLLRARGPIRAYFKALGCRTGSMLRLTLRSDGDFELAPPQGC